MRIDRAKYDSTWSLRELALTSYSDSGQAQYGNIYMRGALTAGLLDIRLLELSGGQRGLQDLIVDLTHRFGKRRAFPGVHLRGHPGRDDLPGDPRLLRPLCLGLATTSDRGVLRQAGDPADEDPDGTPERFEVDSAPTPAQRALRDAWLGRKPRPAS